jgi:predicted DNA-binding transcriptional regulator AlpA
MTAPSVAEMRSWPPAVPLWPHAAEALGLCRSSVYELARRDELPVRTLRLGRLLKVPTADLLAVLGITPDPSHEEGPSASTASGPVLDHLPHSNLEEADRARQA